MDSTAPVLAPLVENRILLVRGQRVLLDSDLAELYGVPTKALNQAVKRNLMRFPEDFMFRLSVAEARHVQSLRSQSVTLEVDTTTDCLRSQIVTLEKGRGRFRKYASNVFTEHGIAMLSSVLSSERAVMVNISIVRTFVRLRELLAANKDLAARMEQMEARQNEQSIDIHRVFETIQRIIDGPDTIEPKRRIGFPSPSAEVAEDCHSVA